MAESKTLVVKLDAEAAEHVRAYAKELEMGADFDGAASDMVIICAGRRAALARYTKKGAKPKKAKRAAKK